MKSFFEAIDRYEGIREAIFEIAQTALLRRVRSDPQLTRLREANLRVGPIDREALAAIWVPTEFPWADLHDAFRPHVKRFEVAIWADRRVCALGYGRPSKGNDNVTIHFLERWMDGRNPLKGAAALLVTEVADLYAIQLGKRSVKLKAPYPAAKSTYLKLGFRPASSIHGIDYLERSIER